MDLEPSCQAQVGESCQECSLPALTDFLRCSRFTQKAANEMWDQLELSLLLFQLQKLQEIIQTQ